MQRISLTNLNVKDIKNAKTQGGYVDEILPAGDYSAKFLGYTEEETYSFFKLVINGKNYNMFYNLLLRDSSDIDANVLNWIKGLATITVTDDTSFTDILQSAVGCTYKINIYNYTSKSGKNAGKTQHAINFKQLPVIQNVEIEEEELDTDMLFNGSQNEDSSDAIIEEDLPF